ncbi:hypothetical protein T484DRAFT_1915933, partial [Baffinella frigidus]
GGWGGLPGFGAFAGLGTQKSRVKLTRAEQRPPRGAEPLCSCGKYGQYQVRATGKDVCSLECKLALITLDTSKGLPGGWEKGSTPDGTPFYIDHNSRSTHWELR